jgi:hypothetical protein
LASPEGKTKNTSQTLSALSVHIQKEFEDESKSEAAPHFPTSPDLIFLKSIRHIKPSLLTEFLHVSITAPLYLFRHNTSEFGRMIRYTPFTYIYCLEPGFPLFEEDIKPI